MNKPLMCPLAPIATSLLLSHALASAQVNVCPSERTVVADVVAIDMPMVFNRLGAQNVNWQMYALAHDLVTRSPGKPPRPLTKAELAAPGSLLGKVTLRPDLRPRPLVVRVAAGDCLEVRFTNLLSRTSNPYEAHKPSLLPSGHPMDQRSRDPNMDIDDQVASRVAGFHPNGLELVDSINSDSSYAGANVGSLAAPGQTRVYRFLTPAHKEGAFLVTNTGAAFGGEGTAGSSGTGLFGMVAVQPPRASFYRGQVTEEELRLATRKLTDPALAGQSAEMQPCAVDPTRACTRRSGHPVIDYEARYPAGVPWVAEGKAGRPILNMLQAEDGVRRLVHGDINAIVVGPEKDGSFPASTYPLESTGKVNPTLPNRLEPFREFASIFHDENAAAQAFPGLFEHPVLGHTLHGVRDAFMINYGSAGVGAEVIANRLGVGPMHDCVDCAFEEFFLSSFTVGDPALLVDTPANLGLEQLVPGTVAGPDLIGVTPEHVQTYVDARGGKIGDVPLLGPKAKKTYYPYDPANVHHSYLGDFVKFRNLHTGKEQHIFHLHNHQWLYNPNDDNSNYIDAQAIGPGSGYTYEIAFGGSGNRNKSSGDAVFHCHYYPHFAQGMWYLWRIHDTFESGTPLEVSRGKREGIHENAFELADGTPAPASRALPDGEIVAGTPIPAVVPLPGKGLAPLPGKVEVVANPRQLADGRPVGSLAKVVDRKVNPGFPFWIAGIEQVVGSRPPTPPLDMDAAVGGFDGGLPRHSVEGLSAGSEAEGKFTRLNAEKHEKKAKPVYFPEMGTDIEQVAMAFHEQSGHATMKVLASGTVDVAEFTTNGAKRTAGAPFFDPCVDDKRRTLHAGVLGEFFGSGGAPLRGSSAFNADTPRIYKGANIQLDVTFNKLGDHYPQQRILTLWEDVDATLATGFTTLPGASEVKSKRPPEPLVLRMNTFDCARYLHTNLVPKEFEMDDYQVKTPTDIIGQHIHLPKWDLPSADGSANGWNYEDGTFSPGMVRSRIHAINEWNAAPPAGASAVLNPYAPGQPAFGTGATPASDTEPLRPRAHYFFGRQGPFQRGDCEVEWESKSYKAFHNRNSEGLALPGACDWLGARTTIQRWFSDPIVNKELEHRGLGITFTHDHLGPSTHQQVGLYATMLTEPPDSTWVHNESGETLYDRDISACNDLDPTTWDGRRCDGGPTSWQAVIRTAKVDEPHREFFLQFGDFQHAYRKDVYRGVDKIGVVAPADTQSFRKALTPSFRQPASPNFPNIIALRADCPGSSRRGEPPESFELKRVSASGDIESYVASLMPRVPRPCPEIISADDIGTMVVNYRQEPLSARVYNPATRQQASNRAGDLAFALQSRTDRAQGALNGAGGEDPSVPGSQPVYGLDPAMGGTEMLDVNRQRRAGDPFTPILRAYSGDLVRVKIQAGSHEHEHNGAVNGLKWLQAGSGYGHAPHSGWRGSQNIGLSEQFTLSMRITDYFEDRYVNATDRLYAMDTSQDGLWNGVWGVVRTLQRRDPQPDKRENERDDQDQLALLPSHLQPTLLAPLDKQLLGNECPADARVRHYDLVAGLANRLLPPAPNTSIPRSRGLDPKGGTLVYNPRLTSVTLNVFHEEDDPATPNVNEKGQLKETRQFGVGPLHDPTAILVVRKVDIDPVTRQLRAGASLEPVVLRAAAGECVQVALENWLPTVRQGQMPDLPGFTTLSKLQPLNEGSGSAQFTSFNNNHVRPSRYIGLHPQLLQYDVQSFDGNVVGVNRRSIVAPGGTMVYKWYAGGLEYAPTPASANVCESSAGPAGGFELVNRLRDQLRMTDAGLRRLRPLNELFTPRTLATRVQHLLAPPGPDEPLPAAVEARLPVSALPLKTRAIELDTTVLAQLQRERRDLGALDLGSFAPSPAGVRQTAFDGLVLQAMSALLAEPAVRACLESPTRGAPLTVEPPAEAMRALGAATNRVLSAAVEPGSDSAPLYPPGAAYSRIDALDVRIACADKLREPMRRALERALEGSSVTPERRAEIAADLAQSVAYLTPGLDEDAYGSLEFANAFRWYEVRDDIGVLNERTTRLAVPKGQRDECRFASIEFGGTNLTPPDRIKQGQKAAVGALVVLPERSFWWEQVDDTALDRQNPGPAPGAVRRSRATASVLYPSQDNGRDDNWRFFRDLVAVHQKGLNLRYGKYPSDGRHGAVGALSAERETAENPPEDRIAPEDAHDAGQMAVNYGSEPMWFRFGIEPTAPFGHGPSMSNPLSRGEGLGGLRFAYQGFSNRCCLTNPTQPSTSATAPVGDPYTPIFKVPPRAEARLRVVMPTGVGRGSTMALHGHHWQRDPYLAEETVPLPPFGALHAPASRPAQHGTPSKCQGSNALAMMLGSQDSVSPMAHFDWLLPSAGGRQGVNGDFLLRDIGGYGVTQGLWSMLRVEGRSLPAAMRKGLRTTCN